jgi:uncharacterized protein YbcV (DUF1398 family)
MDGLADNKPAIQNLKDRITDRLMLAHSYKKVFGDEDGQRVLRHLMRASGILNPKIVTDHNALLVQTGQRQIVLSILKIIGADETKTMRMIEESLNNENQT